MIDIFSKDTTTYNAWTYEYEKCYYGDFTGSAILDIGGDMGSSAVWFVQRGAKKVIVFEKDEKYYPLWEELRHAIGEIADKIEYRKEEATTDKIKDIEYDVLKVDCEGCEMDIINEDILKSKKWMIAVHTFVNGWEKLEEKLIKYGGKKVFDNGGERMYRNI